MKKFNFKLPVTIFKEGDAFIAYTPALDLSTSGKSLQQVKKRFAEAVIIFFEELEEIGTTEDVLRDLGWKKYKQEWKPAIPIAHELQEMAFAV